MSANETASAGIQDTHPIKRCENPTSTWGIQAMAECHQLLKLCIPYWRTHCLRWRSEQPALEYKKQCRSWEARSDSVKTHAHPLLQHNGTRYLIPWCPYQPSAAVSRFYFRSRMRPVIVVAVGYREWLGHRDNIIWLLIRKILTRAKMAPRRVRSWQHWSWHSWRMVVHVTYPYAFFDSFSRTKPNKVLHFRSEAKLPQSHFASTATLCTIETAC